MRILLLIKRFDFGGAENHVCDLANTLVEQGHTVFVLAARGRQVNRLNPQVKYIQFKIKDYILPINALTLCYIVKKHKIQVIHAHQRLSILVACLASKFVKVPVVATVHGRTRFDLKSSFSRRMPSAIIFVSKKVLEVSDSYCHIKDRSYVIPNGVIVCDNDTCRTPFSITYTCRIDRKHSSVILMLIQEVLPKLLNDYPELTLNIIGEGKYFKEIKRKADDLNLKMNREACRVLGYQPEVKKVLETTGLVLGVGRVALEALAHGIPVLSVNQKRLGSFISTENYLLYKENNFVAVDKPEPNSNTIYFLLKDFYSNNEFWCIETKKVLEFIKKDFDLSRITGNIVDIYSKVI